MPQNVGEYIKEVDQDLERSAVLSESFRNQINLQLHHVAALAHEQGFAKGVAHAEARSIKIDGTALSAIREMARIMLITLDNQQGYLTATAFPTMVEGACRVFEARVSRLQPKINVADLITELKTEFANNIRPS